MGNKGIWPVRKWHPIPEVQFFIITGLNPQHTAWLSTFLSYGPLSICLHDPFQRGLCTESFHKEHTYVGLCEPMLHVYDYTLVRASRAVFIIRGYQDTLEASEALQGAPYDSFQRSILQTAHDKLGRMIEMHGQKLVVDFDRLKEYETLKSIWDFCIPHHPMPHEWMMECKRKQIEAIPSRTDPEFEGIMELMLATQ